MSEIVIEKSIPIPHRRNDRNKPPKYPFAEMEVGDSFAISSEEGSDGAAYMEITAHVQNNRKKFPDRKYTVRLIRDKYEIRVWRTK